MAENRRDFLKKALYIAPAIITVSAVPALASAGSVMAPGGPRTPPGHSYRPPRRPRQRFRHTKRGRWFR